MNVWTPQGSASGSLPVMVFIHGGGFTNGSSFEGDGYDGRNLAELGDMVWVTLNHRLNVLGALVLWPEPRAYVQRYAQAQLFASLSGARGDDGGGLIALYLAGLDFSISAAIGFISLFGVAVMDGILNITYFRELCASGMSVAEAVFSGAEQRMRPMLMTALIGISLSDATDHEDVAQRLKDLSEIEDCWFIAGDDSYMLKVRAADVDGLEKIIRRLSGTKGVSRTRTTIVLSTKWENRVGELPEEV